MQNVAEIIQHELSCPRSIFFIYTALSYQHLLQPRPAKRKFITLNNEALKVSRRPAYVNLGVPHQYVEQGVIQINYTRFVLIARCPSEQCIRYTALLLRNANKFTTELMLHTVMHRMQ